MTDTTHDYVAEVDLWDRRIRRLLATIIMHPALSETERAVLMQTLMGKDAADIASDYGFSRQRAQIARTAGWEKVAASLGGKVVAHPKWIAVFHSSAKREHDA